MKKIKFILIFLILLVVISFIIISVMGLKTASDNKVAYNNSILQNIKINKEYIQEEDLSITNREVYLNYDNDGYDNDTELRESTSIYYWDTDGDNLADDTEIEYNTNPLRAETTTGIKDGTKVYISGKELFQKQEGLKLEFPDLDLTITDIDDNSYALGVVIQENAKYINDNAEKSFYVDKINNNSIFSIETNVEDPIIVATDKLFKNQKVVAFNKKDGILTFKHNGQELIYIIGERTKIEELEPKEFTITKSKFPLIGGFKIVENVKGLFGDKDPFIKAEEIKVPEGYKLKSKKIGAIKTFISDGIGNTFGDDLNSTAFVSRKKFNTSFYQMKKELNKEIDNFVQANSFNIQNFSTALVRQNVSGGLAYSLTMFNKNVKNNARHTWDTQSSVATETMYDFTRDLNGYDTILNNRFGEYKFRTKLADRQDLDTTQNPDLQVLKFIEMYNDVFEKNKEKYLVKNKYSADNIDLIIQNINNKNLPVFGLKTKNGGIYLTGYKYEISEFSNNVYKIYVYDPNYKQNKLNGQDISDKLILYMIKKPEWKITGQGTRELTYSLEFVYNPFEVSEYSFSNIENREVDLDIFLF